MIKSIFLCSHLIAGQLLVSVHLVDAVCPGGCLPVGYDDGPGLVLFNEICCPDNWQWQILYIEAECLLDGYDPEIVIGQFVIPGGQKIDTAYEKCLKVLAV